jgi:hypothetical protein
VTKIDVHQHIWREPLVQALTAREELPFIRRERGLTVLFLAGERPYVIDLAAETVEHRIALLERDDVGQALVCLSGPLGIEALPRRQSAGLLDAYHDGALSLGDPRFGVWGALPLEEPDPSDVDRALDAGCVGISLPAGAIAGVDGLLALSRVLARLEDRDAALLVHPGPGRSTPAGAGGLDGARLSDPLWWPALTRYAAQMQAAWLAFCSAGRASHPRLRIVFSMLAGLAPLHWERLQARGGPAVWLSDPLTFYECSSYGHAALSALEPIVGPEQILYGSDRPLVDPLAGREPGWLDLTQSAENTRRAIGPLPQFCRRAVTSPAVPLGSSRAVVSVR